MPAARWRSVIVAVSFVVLGAAAGVSADRLLHRRPSPVVIRPIDVHEDPLGTIDRALDLRPEQRTRIAAILASRQSEIDTAWHDAHRRLRAIVDSVANEIAAELDPEQATRFRQLADELHGRRTLLH